MLTYEREPGACLWRTPIEGHVVPTSVVDGGGVEDNTLGLTDVAACATRWSIRSLFSRRVHWQLARRAVAELVVDGADHHSGACTRIAEREENDNQCF
jgi:hypothetical protein